MNKLLLFALLALPALGVRAQIAIDRAILLEGTDPSDRQVEGIPDPTQWNDALNSRAAALQLMRYGVNTGSANSWVIDLPPPLPDTLPPGAEILVRVSAENTGAVDLTLNGTGPFAVVGRMARPLDSAEVQAGSIVRLLFDGEAFQWHGPLSFAGRDCPAGTVPVNERYCIESTIRDTAHFAPAAITCGDLGGRLCSWGEW
ncbi:MAG: hypothetical protein KDB88_10125, partial [Flavobacteriales bacterium]|nr:hypothetical protein [Flavobacteriales bacterium]